MTRALALLSVLLVAAAPRPAKQQPKAPLEVTRVEENGALFVQLKANQEVADLAVRVEPTDRLVEFKAMKPGEVRKVAVVGASAVAVAARGLPPIRLELSASPPASPAETPRKGAAEKLDRASITREIHNHTKEVRNCYERVLPKNPKLAGKLTIQWTLLPSGKVGSVRIKDSTLADPTIGPCVVASVKTWRFPAGTGETEISFPFVFKAQ